MSTHAVSKSSMGWRVVPAAKPKSLPKYSMPDPKSLASLGLLVSDGANMTSTWEQMMAAGGQSGVTPHVSLKSALPNPHLLLKSASAKSLSGIRTKQKGQTHLPIEHLPKHSGWPFAPALQSPPPLMVPQLSNIVVATPDIDGLSHLSFDHVTKTRLHVATLFDTDVTYPQVQGTLKPSSVANNTLQADTAAESDSDACMPQAPSSVYSPRFPSSPSYSVVTPQSTPKRLKRERSPPSHPCAAECLSPSSFEGSPEHSSPTAFSPFTKPVSRSSQCLALNDSPATPCRSSIASSPTFTPRSSSMATSPSPCSRRSTFSSSPLPCPRRMTAPSARPEAIECLHNGAD